jgi:heat shock protein HslJ
MMKYVIVALCVAVAVSGFYFYSRTPSQIPLDTLPTPVLSNTSWVISSVARTSGALEENILPFGFTLSFDGNKTLQGKICNTFNGSYVENGPSFVASGIVSTKMACEDMIMRYESLLFETLHQGVLYRNDGPTLVLTGVSGSPTFYLSPRSQ